MFNSNSLFVCLLGRYLVYILFRLTLLPVDSYRSSSFILLARLMHNTHTLLIYNSVSWSKTNCYRCQLRYKYLLWNLFYVFCLCLRWELSFLVSCAFKKKLFLTSTQQEKEKAMLNEMVAKLTNVCWDKCVTGTPGSKFSSGESSCLSNCGQRYMDMSILIMKRFQSMQ